MILAIETATPACAVALKMENGETIEKWEYGKGIHSERLFQFMEEVLKEARVGVDNLCAVLVSAGPGSYTGLRIAASAVKGLLFQSKTPLYKVNTLASMAMSVFDSGEYEENTAIHAVIDARRRHLYHQKYVVKNQIPVPEEPVCLRPLDSFEQLIEKGDLLVGTGYERLGEQVQARLDVKPKKWIRAKPAIGWYGLYQADKESISEDKLMEKYGGIIEPADVITFEPDYHTEHQTVRKKQ